MPELELLASPDNPLGNGTVQAQASGQFTHFPIVLKNSGAGISGKIYIKIYATKAVNLESASADERTFDSETTVAGAGFNPNEIPGGFSVQINFNLRRADSSAIPSGKYMALAKVYYGAGKVVRVPFYISIPYDRENARCNGGMQRRVFRPSDGRSAMGAAPP
jgi:hypothetical protein